MKVKSKQSGLTLTEMVVVIGTIALLVGLGVPAGRAFLNSFETESGAKSMISAALASARAIAAKEQRYAGVRFQKAYDPAGLLKARQYMIFIIQDPNVMAYGFRAVEGLKPIKLPDSIGVMDLTIVTNRNAINPVNPTQVRIDDPLLSDNERDNLINEGRELTDTTTFSIIFSPSGKLVIHGIRVRNRDGEGDSPSYTDLSKDDIFNKKAKVDAGIAMFYQDDYFGGSNPDLGLGPEPSRRSFIIYDKTQFEKVNPNGRWSDYLRHLDIIYINPYTGTIISAD